jgi:adenine/guanine phosphoribosyltransferase-like PRPP-binding protein
MTPIREAVDVNGVRLGVVPRLNTDTRPYKILMDIAGDSMAYAIEPGRLHRAARTLVDGLDLAAEPDCVIGLAPGGIAFAVAVATVLDVKAVIAYKTRLGLDGELRFSEPHATNSIFYLYGVGAGDTVVLIDDEIDSGNTLADCVRSLQAAGARILAAGTAVEGLHGGRSEGRAQLTELGVPLTSLAKFEVADGR